MKSENSKIRWPFMNDDWRKWSTRCAFFPTMKAFKTYA